MENYVSVSEILEAVYRDEGYAHELDWGDAISWIGEVIGLIGANKMYVDKTTGNSLLTPNITIANFRGVLPIDFKSILPGGVRNVDSNEVAKAATDSFHTRQRITGETAEHPTNVLTCTIKDNYIDVNLESGTIELAYRAFKVDDNGFPMIPDNERVKLCVKHYITAKLDHRLWRLNKISDKVYAKSEQDKDWYIGSAQSIMKQMTPDQRAAWTTYWTRLMPVIISNDYSNAYMNVNEDLNIGYNNLNNGSIPEYISKA